MYAPRREDDREVLDAVSRPAGDPAQTRARVVEALRGIAAREFAPRPGEQCGWCDFLSFCDAGRAFTAGVRT